jgi:uncharacterized protein YkwD
MITIGSPYRHGLCAVALASALNIGAASVYANFASRVLDAQNAERAQLGLAPLRWNPQLAASAAAWANRLAATHRFEHAPENPIRPEGENLWRGTHGYFPPEAMVNAWIREKKYFKPGIFPDNSTTGNVEDVGHFTQIAWRNTSEVGCALAENDADDVLACRYSQAGNYVGERPF